MVSDQSDSINGDLDLASVSIEKVRLFYVK